MGEGGRYPFYSSWLVQVAGSQGAREELMANIREAIEGAREQIAGVPLPNEFQKSARLLEVTV